MTTPKERPPMVHDLKCWPEFFAAVLDGSKTFEVRKDDREYAVGDVLRLREFHPSDGSYTGREVRKRVTYILRNPYLIADGHCVLALAEVPHA